MAYPFLLLCLTVLCSAQALVARPVEELFSIHKSCHGKPLDDIFEDASTLLASGQASNEMLRYRGRLRPEEQVWKARDEVDEIGKRLSVAINMYGVTDIDRNHRGPLHTMDQDLLKEGARIVRKAQSLLAGEVESTDTGRISLNPRTSHIICSGEAYTDTQLARVIDLSKPSVMTVLGEYGVLMFSYVDQRDEKGVQQLRIRRTNLSGDDICGDDDDDNRYAVTMGAFEYRRVTVPTTQMILCPAFFAKPLPRLEGYEPKQGASAEDLLYAAGILVSQRMIMCRKTTLSLQDDRLSFRSPPSSQPAQVPSSHWLTSPRSTNCSTCSDVRSMTRPFFRFAQVKTSMPTALRRLPSWHVTRKTTKRYKRRMKRATRRWTESRLMLCVSRKRITSSHS